MTIKSFLYINVGHIPRFSWWHWFSPRCSRNSQNNVICFKSPKFFNWIFISRSLTKSAFAALYRCNILGKCGNNQKKANPTQTKLKKDNIDLVEVFLRKGNVKKITVKPNKKKTKIPDGRVRSRMAGRSQAKTTVRSQAKTTVRSQQTKDPRSFGLADLMKAPLRTDM